MKRQKSKSKQVKVAPNPQLELSAITLPQYQSNIFTRQFSLDSLISFKCTHITFFICWFGLVIAGTTIIGFGASNYSATYEYCGEGQDFCFYDVTMDKDREIFIYAKLSQFYQNNRMYLDAYSYKQTNGQNGTGRQCSKYKTYGSIGVTETVGGYRVTSDKFIHPCGFPMISIFNDSMYIVDSSGGTPTLANRTISNYSLAYRFKHLPNYQVAQWIDTLSNIFINWFTIATTPTKYVLMGRLSMSAGLYRMIVKNNYPTHGQFEKEIVMSQVNNLGVTNHLLGFTIFAYGIGMLLVHVAICCKSRQ